MLNLFPLLSCFFQAYFRLLLSVVLFILCASWLILRCVLRFWILSFLLNILLIFLFAYYCCYHFVSLVSVNYWHESPFQMLTMRNGLSLYPMYLPGALQPAQLTQMPKGFYEGNGTDVTGISFNQETSTNTLFDIPNQSTNPAQLTAVDLSSTLSSETLFGRESAIEGDLRPLQFHTSSNSKVSLHV